MEDIYHYFLKHFKEKKEPVDYDLLLSILLSFRKESLIVEDTYRPMIYYQNSKVIDECIEQLLIDLQISKEEMIKDLSDVDEEDMIWDIFPSSIDYIVDLVTEENVDKQELHTTYFEKVKEYKEKIS